ncbi:MAG: hypothetical protein HRU40_19940 [Saprospiraceae bacterium]|nr:hypothetical protein [Saprospiraceae bacterium]
MEERKILIDQLESQNVLWSYDVSRTDDLPDEVLMEETLLHGDVDQLKLLFSIFPAEGLQAFWEEKLVPHERYCRINHYLGLFFFEVPDISSFLDQRIVAYPRLERLRLLIAED